MRSLVLGVCLALMIVGCGDGELSMTDYAAQLEDLVATMNRKIDSLDVEIRSQPPSLEGSLDFWKSKVVARRELIDGLQALEPPAEAAEMHAAAIGIIDRLAVADKAVAELVASMETDQELSDLLQSPEYLATEAVDEEAIELCVAAQTEFDSTADREVFGDMPWIPSDLREVVTVVFGCTKEERGVTP